MMAEEKETKTEKVTKKLDDVKDSPENKAALAAHAGVPSDEGKAEGKNLTTDDTVPSPVNNSDGLGHANSHGPEKKEKVESKPAVAKESKKDKKVEAKVELEREYVVPLKRGVLNVPHYRRAKKAVKVLKQFMVRHMNIRDGDLRKVKVDINLNNEIWFRGIKKPMNKVKVKATKIDGIVYVELAEIPAAVGFKIAREARLKAEAGASKVKAPKKSKEKEDDDKDGDGVSDKKEEKEDARSGAEKAAKVEKAVAKDMKHTAQGKHMKKTMPVRKVLK